MAAATVTCPADLGAIVGRVSQCVPLRTFGSCNASLLPSFRGLGRDGRLQCKPLPPRARGAWKQCSKRRVAAPRALDLEPDQLVAIGVGLAGIAVGIAIPVFYETQVKSSESRENDQPCFPCKGTGAQNCRFCQGDGKISLELGGGEKEVSSCINCDGKGAITCTTCQGSGIQPRYLDRREFKDDD